MTNETKRMINIIEAVKTLKEEYKAVEQIEKPNAKLLDHYYYNPSQAPERDHTKVDKTLGNDEFLMKEMLLKCLKMDPKSPYFIESSCMVLTGVDKFLKFGTHNRIDLSNDGINVIDDCVSLYIKMVYAEEGVEFFTDTKNFGPLMFFSGIAWNGLYRYRNKDIMVVYNMVKRLISEFPNIGNRIRNCPDEIISNFCRTMLFHSPEINRKNLAPMIRTIDGYVDYTGSIVPLNDEIVYPAMTPQKAENVSKFIAEFRNILLNVGLPLSDIDEFFRVAFKKFNTKHTGKENAVKYIYKYLKSESACETILFILRKLYDDYDKDDNDPVFDVVLELPDDDDDD